MLKPSLLTALVFSLTSCVHLPPPPRESVGNMIDGKTIVTTLQLIHPAGQSVEFGGRPVDLVLSPNGETVYVKDNHSLFSLDVASWKILHTLPFGAKEGGSMFGLAISPDGKKLFATSTLNRLREANISGDGKLSWGRSFELKGTDPKAKTGPKTTSYPCGVTLSKDVKTACVCLSINNTLAVVDLTRAAQTAEIPVGVAPYAVVLSPDEHLAYVSNWGGRRAKKGEKTAKSAGTNTLVDDRGVASSGTVSVVDLHQKKEIAQITVGLHPADMRLNTAGTRLYVANANSDTVSVIDTTSRKVIDTILVRPDPTLPFGSASNALALSTDETKLFVANGGNNAVAVISLNESAPSHVEGFIPAGWYPGAIVTDGHQLFIANTKGLGSRQPKPKQTHWAVQQYQGTITKVEIPGADQLSTYTQQVRNDSRVPQTLAAWEKAQSDVKPVPVPQHVGEPSVFEHVVYVIKENRTYDQVLGDIGKGNSDPRLCVFGRNATPNLHALAEQFVLLDNFYCNGVISADGHAWVTEGLAVDYLEKSFGGFVRSYPFGGDDPLAFASSGFIWDDVLLHGRSFRNYGEMVLTHLAPRTATFTDVYTDFHTGSHRAKLTHQISNASLRPYTCPDYPGWNLKVEDAMRMDAFIKEFEEFKRKGEWPDFVTVYLPSDHTSGTSEKAPIPAAMAADNDLAVGRLVEAISHSPFWAKTCIFVIEDDPQAGFDHVDGHRSVCWVISPYTKRQAIDSSFYNQTSVLHTMELMLGLPPMNQMDAMAPVMRDCFVATPDLKPYTALPNRIPLNKMNPKKVALSGEELKLAQTSEQQDFSEPDLVNDDAMNRILWHSVKGVETPYPATYAGAHGKGLKALHLKPFDGDDDDDD
jgi:YVTN family beta-propeller protein